MGESPVYDYRENKLCYVDIEGFAIRSLDLDTGEGREMKFGDYVTSVQLHASGGLAATFRHGYYLVEPDGSAHLVAEVEADESRNRFNDGKCDAKGRYWAGTMNLDLQSPTGALYSLDLDRSVRRHVGGFAISNGIAWSLDGGTMYFVETASRRIYSFDFDAEKGAIDRMRVALDMSGEAGRPDGIAVDAEGMLWVAHARGGRISRWDVERGEKLAEVELPVKAVTSLAFGGPDLGLLYVTTASWSGEELAGRVLELDVGVKGLRPNLCRF